MVSIASATRTRVILAGANGFGRVHLAALEKLTDRVELVGLVDPHSGPTEGFGSDVPLHPTLAEAFAATPADIVIVATPIGTHASLAEAAMRHGADVYLEKPTVATMADFEWLSAVQAETGRVVQVGFQSFGSHAIAAISSLGDIWSVAASASWLRNRAYWKRSPWAGRRVIDGAPVVDGVVTNPLAHAVATALLLAGARRREDVAGVEVELYRANDIESDDTTSLRVRLVGGGVVSAALTLCSTVQREPELSVRVNGAGGAGSSTDALFRYTLDEVTVDGTTTAYGRTSLFENLLENRADGTPLLSALADTGAFMEVLEAIRTAEEPRLIDPSHVAWVGEGDAAHAVVEDVDWWVERASAAGALFSEIGVPWAAAVVPGESLPIDLGDARIARRDDGSTVTPTSSPRPFLHPLATLGGTTVTAAHPIDHDWHLGLSLGIQHVDDVNFWGGRTYVRDRGYTWRDDHGRIDTVSLAQIPGGYVESTEWMAPDGTLLLHGETTFSASTIDETTWGFEFSYLLTPARSTPARIGSPGSNGKEGGGYGGLSWRLPRVSDVDVRTRNERGEDACHGSIAPWIAWSASFDGAPATIALGGADDVTAADPWFVRVADYPGIGSSLAWDSEVIVTAPLRRSFRGIVADGILSDERVTKLLETLR